MCRKLQGACLGPGLVVVANVALEAPGSKTLSQLHPLATSMFYVPPYMLAADHSRPGKPACFGHGNVIFPFNVKARRDWELGRGKKGCGCCCTACGGQKLLRLCVVKCIHRGLVEFPQAYTRLNCIQPVLFCLPLAKHNGKLTQDLLFVVSRGRESPILFTWAALGPNRVLPQTIIGKICGPGCGRRGLLLLELPLLPHPGYLIPLPSEDNHRFQIFPGIPLFPHAALCCQWVAACLSQDPH